MNQILLLATKKPDFDEDSVTPGVIGFIATFLIIAAVVLLVLDMVRRVRRTQYRAEIRELLSQEAADTERKPGDVRDDASGDSSGDLPDTAPGDKPVDDRP